MIEENRNFDSKPKDFLKRQGFYIVLFICLLIVGTAIVLTTMPREGQEDASQSQQQTDPQQQQSLLEARQASDETLLSRNTPLPTATPQPSATPTPTPTSKPTSARAASVKKGIAPVTGEVIWGYAEKQLLYSRTLDQWTTHAGVDLAAEVGANVVATLAGSVEKVYEDDALGTVLTIAHNNGRMSLYANLDPTVPVQAGQKVNAGDVIGKVGNSAVSECGDLPHLHFGFLVDSKPVDPMEYVTIPH